jgi:hypothetical protein
MIGLNDCLMFAAKNLDDEMTLSDCVIERDSTVYLVHALHGGGAAEFVDKSEATAPVPCTFEKDAAKWPWIKPGDALEDMCGKSSREAYGQSIALG